MTRRPYLFTAVFWQAVFVRAVRTASGTTVAVFTGQTLVGMSVRESVYTIVSTTVLSVLQAVATGLPETQDDPAPVNPQAQTVQQIVAKHRAS